MTTGRAVSGMLDESKWHTILSGPAKIKCNALSGLHRQYLVWTATETLIPFKFLFSMTYSVSIPLRNP